MSTDLLVLGGRTFHSRLLIGTGKFKDFDETRAAIEASGAELVTVAIRRVDLTQKGSLRDAIPKRCSILPNTAGCYTAQDAVRTAHLGRELCDTPLVKLEVIGDEKTLFPDTAATLHAAEILVKEGFVVLPYTNDDPVMAKKLAAVGCAAVMPLGAPIGSGLGIRNPHNLKILLEGVSVPVIVDAGVGAASDAAIALELGCDAVLMNTGVAAAQQPVLMAEAMRLAVEAGRKSFLAGRMAKRLYAHASSPTEQLLAPLQ